MVKTARKPERKLFVEGGGDHNPTLQTECRQGFSELLRKAGIGGRMPRIVVCGPRKNAYDQFCTSLSDPVDGDVSILLVDAEAPVTATSPWDHVKERIGDGWQKPAGASDDHLHLMVQCMEAWFLADQRAMMAFFGNGFIHNALPTAPTASKPPETVSKGQLDTTLKTATKNTKPGTYTKGRHSFKLLATIDPTLVRKGSPWADRFFMTLDRLLR